MTGRFALAAAVALAVPSLGRRARAAEGEYEAAHWREAFGPDEVIQRVRPGEFFGYVRNPHRGTATFQRFNGDPLYPDIWWNDRVAPVRFKPFDGNVKNERYPDTTIAYCRWLWSVIEPQKGKCRWDVIDGALRAARERGQTLQVRIQPYVLDDAPAWYWKAGRPVKGDRRDIDHNDPAYLEHWGEFIREFGERYDGHPDLESFDVAYGGFCGECGGNCTPETAEKLVDVYLESFKKTRLISMLGPHGCTYAATKEDRNIGWRADCFGDLRSFGHGVVPDGLCWRHMHDLYPRQIVECGLKDAWKTAPVVLETAWTVGFWHRNGWDIDWILEQGRRYHVSVFMPKSCYVPEEWWEEIREFDNRIGYRFVLRQMTLPLEAKPGDGIGIQMYLDNVGCAPIYRPYKLAYRFRQEKTVEVVHSGADIRTWMPDEPTWFKETVTFPKALRPGEVKVDVGIVDGRTNEAKVKFAIKETAEDGWHPMTSMDVLHVPGTAVSGTREAE